MSDKYLKRLYHKFCFYEERRVGKMAVSNITDITGYRPHFSSKELKFIYRNYYRPSFLDFLRQIVLILKAPKLEYFVTQSAKDCDHLRLLLDFLLKEKVIQINQARVSLISKFDEKFLLEPISVDTIKHRLEQVVKKKLKPQKPNPDLFRETGFIETKRQYDQLPISQGSAVFLAEKILANLPVSDRPFLLVGDDDLFSVVLNIVQPKLKIVVVDIDEELLRLIAVLTKKFGLNIETRKVDVNKTKRLKEAFQGFLCNPPYNEAGVRQFISWGVRQLSQEGGFVFLELGNEAIFNHYLFLQEFFSQQQLIIEEIVKGKIIYPASSLYQSNRESYQRFKEIFSRRQANRIPAIGASLYIFNYIPYKIERRKLAAQRIYDYL